MYSSQFALSIPRLSDPLLAHHVAVSSQRVLGVAAAGLTASVLTVVPVVGGALVTVMARHVLPAGAGPALPVTVTLSVRARRLQRASSHTSTA